MPRQLLTPLERAEPWNLLNALWRMRFAAGFLIPWLIIGCSPFRSPEKRGYQTLPDHPQAQADVARALNTKGLVAMQKGDLARAEQLFGDALAADVNYGPAHNNLGQIYLKRHQLYLAAWEFEFAAELMPERIEGLLNLGLVYETAGDSQRALPYYEAAHEIDPTDANAVGNLARVSVKLDLPLPRVNWLLREVIMRDDRPEWIGWAETLLATKYRMDSDDATFLEVIDDRSLPEQLDRREELPVPQPVISPGRFDMPDAIPLDLNSGFRSGLLMDLPHVPSSPVVPAGFERSP